MADTKRPADGAVPGESVRPPRSAKMPAAPTQTVEEWAEMLETEQVWLDAALLAQGWQTNKLVDQETYEAAIYDAQKVEAR